MAPPPTKLQRLGAALAARAQAGALLLLCAGVAAALLAPLSARKCYLDEKALLVGGALPTVRWV